VLSEGNVRPLSPAKSTINEAVTSVVPETRSPAGVITTFPTLIEAAANGQLKMKRKMIMMLKDNLEVIILNSPHLLKERLDALFKDRSLRILL
jgi:hypothetical protein